MERAFISTHPWNPARIGAMAIYCSDGRWGEAFDEFCHEGLRIPRYDRFAVPGGPLWLVMRDVSLMIPHSAARDQLQFLVKAHQLERIVLFGHEGCAYYSHLLGPDPEACLAAQLEDLRVGAKTLSGWFPAMTIEAYMARRSGERLSFHPLALR
jgi:carbonic anhydrase-like protein